MQIQACSSTFAVNVLGQKVQHLQEFVQVLGQTHLIPALLSETLRGVNNGYSSKQMISELKKRLKPLVESSKVKPVLPSLLSFYVFENALPCLGNIEAYDSNKQLFVVLHAHALEHIRRLHMMQAGLSSDTAWWRSFLAASDPATVDVMDAQKPELHFADFKWSHSTVKGLPNVFDVHFHATLLGTAVCVLPFTAQQCAVTGICVEIASKTPSVKILHGSSCSVLELVAPHSHEEPAVSGNKALVYSGTHVVAGVQLCPLVALRNNHLSNSADQESQAFVEDLSKTICHLHYESVARVQTAIQLSPSDAVVSAVGSQGSMDGSCEEIPTTQSISDDTFSTALDELFSVEGEWSIGFTDRAAAHVLQPKDVSAAHPTAASLGQPGGIYVLPGQLSMCIPLAPTKAKSEE